jgi:predicted SAM-dependent methyltransferase
MESARHRIVLHVGCGKEKIVHQLFQDWEEIVRVDIDPEVQPDVIDDIRTLSRYPAEFVDGIYSSHNLEHLNFLDVEQALATFYRVLKPNGMLVVTVPDFEYACQRVVEGKLFEKVYDSEAGPITAADMIFGFIPYTRTNQWQCHKFGFTRSVLEQMLFRQKFFANVMRDGQYALWGYARKM